MTNKIVVPVLKLISPETAALAWKVFSVGPPPSDAWINNYYLKACEDYADHYFDLQSKLKGRRAKKHFRKIFIEYREKVNRKAKIL